MINAKVINTSEIHSSGVFVDLSTDTIECTCSASSEYTRYVNLGTQCYCICECEATPLHLSAPTALLTCSCTMKMGIKRTTHLHADLSCSSSMLPSETIVKFLALSELNTASDVDVKPYYYRKGRPTISISKYSIRRFNGRLIILKDEYI